MSMRNVTITIDGKVVEIDEGENILMAAEKAGSYIPSLCNHPDLPPSSGQKPVKRVFRGDNSFQGCRLCLVDVEGEEDLEQACDTSVKDGMIWMISFEQEAWKWRYHLEESRANKGSRTAIRGLE